MVNVSDRIAAAALVASLLSLGVSGYVAHEQRDREVSSRARNVVAYEPNTAKKINQKSVQDYRVDNYDAHPVLAVVIVWPGQDGRQIVLGTPVLGPCMRFSALETLAKNPDAVQDVPEPVIDFYESKVYFWDSDGQAWMITGNSAKHSRPKSADLAKVKKLFEANDFVSLPAAAPIEGCKS